MSLETREGKGNTSSFSPVLLIIFQIELFLGTNARIGPEWSLIDRAFYRKRLRSLVSKIANVLEEAYPRNETWLIDLCEILMSFRHQIFRIL